MHRKDVFAFRFFAITPADLDALREHCSDVLSRPARGREGMVTGVFDLHEQRDYSWLAEFIEARGISANDYGLFVSVSTSSDSEIVTVPPYAANLFRAVGGELDFSFTVLTDD